MKTKIIVLCFIFGTFTKMIAQEPVTSYYKEMKEVTKTLDSTKFKNNILYDRVYPLAKLNEFNQNQRIDTSSVTHFLQASHELNLASNKKAH